MRFLAEDRRNFPSKGVASMRERDIELFYTSAYLPRYRFCLRFVQYHAKSSRSRVVPLCFFFAQFDVSQLTYITLRVSFMVSFYVVHQIA